MTPPWTSHADALCATEGDYADFRGWEAWLQTSPYADLLSAVENPVDRVLLYGLCCALWQHSLF